EADALAAWNTFGGELHADGIDLICRHGDAAAPAADLVRYFSFVQRSDDFRGFGLVQFTVEQRVIGAAGPKHQSAEPGENHQSGQKKADTLVDPKLLPNRVELSTQLRKAVIHSLIRRPPLDLH